MLCIFSRNALCKQCWNKTRGAVCGKDFYYLPNFRRVTEKLFITFQTFAERLKSFLLPSKLSPSDWKAFYYLPNFRRVTEKFFITFRQSFAEWLPPQAMANHCRGKLRCSICSGEHKYSECSTAAPKCPNCGGSHSANEKICPRYQRETEILKLKTG